MFPRFNNEPIYYYILKDHIPVPEPDIMAWSHWMDTAPERTLRATDVLPWSVSTIFLGVRSTIFPEPWDAPPRLFETAIFGPDGLAITRTATWDQALTAHQCAIFSLLMEVYTDGTTNPFSCGRSRRN
jgi:hypothetical protein